MARIRATMLVVVIVATGCSSSADTTTTSSDATTSPTSTTATVAPPTTADTTPTTVEATSTTSPEDPLILIVSGGTVVHTMDGTVLVEGWVDRPAMVTVGGSSTTSHTDPDGRTSFSTELTGVDVGRHVIPVEAMAGDGDSAAVMLTVVHEPGLEREFAYLVEVDGDAGVVVADYAEWFTGEAAEVAAAEDGTANPDGTVDGGFYIRNVDDRLRTLEVAHDAPVVLHACYVEGPCLTREAVSFEIFADLVAEPAGTDDLLGWQWYGSGTLPHWLLVDDGVVIAIHEHYLP